MPLDAQDIQHAEAIEVLLKEAGLGDAKTFVHAVIGISRPDSIWRKHLWEALEKVATLAAFAAHEAHEKDSTA